VAPTIIAVFVVLLLLLLFAGSAEEEEEDGALGVPVPVPMAEVVVGTDSVAVWEGEVSVVVLVWEVCCRVGSGVGAAVLDDAADVVVVVVVKALYSCVLSGLSAQAR
jgi:hypothetical protein